jgi:hypothetical protein
VSAVEHIPEPVGTVGDAPVSLCAVCFEKIRQLPDGSWEHFGQDKPYEPMTP